MAELVKYAGTFSDRASGVTVPVADLLIIACAKIHRPRDRSRRYPFDELLRLEA